MDTDKAAANRQLVLDFYEAAGQGDIDRAKATLADDITIFGPPYLPWAGPYVGLENYLRDCLPQITRHLRVEDAVMSFAIADEKRVVVAVSVPSRHDGTDCLVMENWTIEDGVATELQVFYWDPFAILDAVRALSPAAD